MVMDADRDRGKAVGRESSRSVSSVVDLQAQWHGRLSHSEETAVVQGTVYDRSTERTPTGQTTSSGTGSSILPTNTTGNRRNRNKNCCHNRPTATASNASRILDSPLNLIARSANVTFTKALPFSSSPWLLSLACNHHQ